MKAEKTKREEEPIQWEKQKNKKGKKEKTHQGGAADFKSGDWDAFLGGF